MRTKHKFIVFLGFFSILFSFQAQAKLNPQSFDAMYNLASSGKIGVLKEAVYRGLNINAVNEDGDTGLCVAIRRGDYRAYNSFRAAGAAPHTYCTGTIDRDDYKSFMESSNIPEFFKYEHNAFYENQSRHKSSVLPWVLGGLGIVVILALAL